MKGKWVGASVGALGTLTLSPGTTSPPPQAPVTVVRVEQGHRLVFDNDGSDETRHARHPLHIPANLPVPVFTTSANSLSSGDTISMRATFFDILVPVTEYMDGVVTDRGNEEVALLHGQIVRVFRLT